MFQNNEKKKSKINWSWLAFLFTPLWLGYNGMYALYTVNLLSYTIELIINYILAVNNVDFQMIGVLPSISSIIFGLYGKNFKQNLEEKLSKKGKTLQKSWLALIGTLFMSAIILGMIVYIIIHNFFFESSSNLTVFSFISGLSSINYLIMFLFQGIMSFVLFAITLFFIGMACFLLYVQNFVGYSLHYSSEAGTEDFLRNIPNRVEEKLDELHDVDNNYLALEKVSKGDASDGDFIEAIYCGKDGDKKFYHIMHMVTAKEAEYTSIVCHDKETTTSLFTKFYNKDDSYKTTIKWEPAK